MTTKRPEIVTDEHLEYLDTLRDSGVTNMYGATPYLVDAFNLHRREAGHILQYWMESFVELHGG